MGDRRLFLGVDIKYFIIQVVIVFYNFANIFENVGNQYVFSRVAEEWNFTTKVRGKSQCYQNVTDPNYVIQQKVQNQATQWELYLSLSSGIPAMFMVIILGAASDRTGRRFLLIVACIGSACRAITYIVVTWLHLNLYYLLIGHILEGLGGFRFMIFVAIFALTSDYTEADQKRSLLMTILQVTSDFALAIALVTSGFAIRDIGFYLPNVICLILLIVNVFVIVFFLNEASETQSISQLGYSLVQSFTNSFKFYFSKAYKGRQTIYILGIAIYLFPSMTHFGHGNVATYFQLNSPLCWDSVKLGTNTAIDAFIHPIGLLILVKVLQNWFSDIGIAVLGVLSTIAALVLEGLAINDIMMYIMYVVGILSLTPMIFMKAILSKVTEKETQGALFAGFGFIDCVTYIVGQFFYTKVYESTLNIKTGAVFLVMAGQYLITLTLLGVLYTQRGKLSSTKVKESVVN